VLPMCPFQSTKLYALGEYILGAQGDAAKKKQFQEKDWRESPLSQEEVIYCAEDAIVSCELALRYLVSCDSRPRRTWPRQEAVDADSGAVLRAAAGAMGAR